MAFLGLDLGTTGVRALVVDRDGRVLGAATAEHPLSNPAPGWMEQEPADWWRAACTAIPQALERASLPPSAVEAVGVSGQMHGATLLDSTGGVVRPCILWNDQRSAPQCVEITERVGSQRLLELTGNAALAGFTAPKLLWVRQHEPDNWARTAHVLLPRDYLNYRLTGALSCEPSDAAGTLLFDVRAREWSEPMMEALELNPSLFPPLVPSAGPAGVLSAEAAADTGLRAGTLVVGGGADNACAAAGCGVLEPGQVLCSIGTSGTVLAPVGLTVPTPGYNVHLFSHVTPRANYLMGVVLSAGGALRWFRDAFYADALEAERAGGGDAYEAITVEAAATPPGASGLLFLPYLTGERTPHGSASARGVFFGLGPQHTRGHMARAVIEGVSYALLQSLDLLRDAGVVVQTVRLTGGGARSPFWRGILADMFGCPVLRLPHDEGPAYGAALLAAVGAGAFPTLEAAGTLVLEGEATQPRPQATARYAQGSALFRSLYTALVPSFTQLMELEIAPLVEPDL